jgi:hypothetical protein
MFPIQQFLYLIVSLSVMNLSEVFVFSFHVLLQRLFFLIFYSESTLVVTESIQPGIVVNLQTENSFLAIVKSSAISNFVNVTGLGTLELRTDTYV